MTHSKLRIARADADVLVGNLRGEVGEAITTWILLRHIMSQGAHLRSDDPGEDLGNHELAFLDNLADRLRNDLIASLSELAEEKIGRTNFHFVETKLGLTFAQIARFRDFVEKRQFRKKRNQEIAHREQAEKWLDPGLTPIRIRYKTLLKGLALAVAAMKSLDRHHLGPPAPYLWHEVRKKRYEFFSPARVGYILLPHMRLPSSVVAKLSEQANRAGN